jgi:DNA-binding beta-propeller fold protein YncE
MRKAFTIIFVLLLIYSCKQSEYYDVAYRITEKDLIPEGITFSTLTNSFYVSSIYKTKIVQIDANTGEFKDFTLPGLLGLRMLGMVVDDERKHLWACGNISRDNKEISAIVKLDLITGDLIKVYEYVDTFSNTFNDLVLDKQGNVFFTNSSTQTIYQINNDVDSITVYYDGKSVEYPNGITISPDNKYLYVASGNNGIRIINIATKEIVNSDNSNFNSKGIDGLKYYNKSIIGIQNYVANPSDRNICRYFLNEEGTEIISTEIIDKNNPYFDVPTTFVLDDNSLFCLANSQLLNINNEYKIIDIEALQDIIVLKYEL